MEEEYSPFPTPIAKGKKPTEEKPLISYWFQNCGSDIGNTFVPKVENILALKKASKITVMLKNIFQL